MAISEQFGLTRQTAALASSLPTVSKQPSQFRVQHSATPAHDEVTLRFGMDADKLHRRRFGIVTTLLALLMGGGAASHVYHTNKFTNDLETTRTTISTTYDGKLATQREDFDSQLARQRREYTQIIEDNSASWKQILEEQQRANEAQARDLSSKLDAQDGKLTHQESVITEQKVKLDTQSAELAALKAAKLASDVQIQKTMAMVQKNVMMMRLKYEDGSFDSGHASGFIVKDRGGKLHFVSCTHGVDDPHYQYDGKGKYTPVPKAEVTMSDGTKFMAKLRHASPVAVMDISVWDIEGDAKLMGKLGDHALQFRDLTKISKDARNDRGVEMGEPVISGGYPFGYKARVSPGLVTALDVVKTNQKVPAEHLEVQISSVIAPGNSGGPSTDKEGYVIGVNLSIDQRSSMFNFMLPDLPLRTYLSRNGVDVLSPDERASVDVKSVEAAEARLTKAFSDRRALFDSAVTKFDKDGVKKIEDFLKTNDTNTNMHFALYDKTFRQQLEGEGIDPAGKHTDEQKTTVNKMVFQHLAKSGLLGAALMLPPGSYTIGSNGFVPPPAPPPKVEKKPEAPPPIPGPRELRPGTLPIPIPRELEEMLPQQSGGPIWRRFNAP